MSRINRLTHLDGRDGERSGKSHGSLLGLERNKVSIVSLAHHHISARNSFLLRQRGVEEAELLTLRRRMEAIVMGFGCF